MKRRICILGATGSIGKQTIDVAQQHRDIEVVSMCCNSNISEFEKQVRLLKPKAVCVYDENKYKELKVALSDMDIDILSGMTGINTIVEDIDVDIVVSGISGMIGIEPTLTAIEAGKTIALANKETLVTAGDIVMSKAKEKNVEIIPVDSEHSAIYQCIKGNNSNEIEKLILTASGGPFRGYTYEQLKDVTISQALKHPNWSMGAKITIDSSTLVNKGLEIIEAAKLFGMPKDKIEVVVHPQSIIHSMVQFVDGAILAQLGTSSMKVPIQYAIYGSSRKELDVERVDFFKLKNLTFESPDLDTFRGLTLCMKALEIGGSMTAVLNAANEIAVDQFLRGKIKYLDIISMIETAMNEHSVIKNPTLEDIYDTIRQVKERFSDN